MQAPGCGAAPVLGGVKAEALWLAPAFTGRAGEDRAGKPGWGCALLRSWRAALGGRGGLEAHHRALQAAARAAAGRREWAGQQGSIFPATKAPGPGWSVPCRLCRGLQRCKWVITD